MIEPSDRFWVVGEQVKGNVHTGQVIDWDQRRWYTIEGPVSLIPPDENVDIDVLKCYVGQLGQTVQSITVDDKGLLVKVSSDPEDDRTLTTHYPRFATAPSLQNCLTVHLSQLTEEDRLGPSVDLVSYVDDSGTSKFAVFKYYMIYQTRHWIRNELHLTKALPRHPNILPFDRVVLSDAEPRILGFTTPYIHNGTIEQNKDRVFKLAWLQQLLDVVDYLNFDLGIAHQDIAPRNLLVDPKTDNLLLFDFDRAARIGQPSCFPPSGTMHVDFTPDLPDVPPASPIITGNDDSGEPVWGDDLIQHRKDALNRQKSIIVWERAPRQLAPIE
ncbi:hypothetical protein V499_04701 [Pseudogymnoascus sp. VKM F-103]|nr:hypothetical protein V499_04701 [Pseudogymnoascus sp. VKM F-103]